MRITVFVVAAALLGGIYYVQESPQIKQKIKHTFSRENLLEVKFKDPEKQKKQIFIVLSGFQIITIRPSENIQTALLFGWRKSFAQAACLFS